MKNLDLNSKEFDSKEFRPFNEGRAGIAEVIISEISKNEEKQYWKIVFQDKDGSKLPDFYRYIKLEHPKTDEWANAQGKELKHYWKVIVGDTKIPVFETPVQMLDTIMNTLKENMVGKVFQLAVDYGYGNRHSKYLQRKKFIPFIENATDEKSSLYLSANSHTKPAFESDSTSSLNTMKDDSEKSSHDENWPI